MNRCSIDKPTLNYNGHNLSSLFDVDNVEELLQMLDKQYVDDTKVTNDNDIITIMDKLNYKHVKMDLKSNLINLKAIQSTNMVFTSQFQKVARMVVLKVYTIMLQNLISLVCTQV